MIFTTLQPHAHLNLLHSLQSLAIVVGPLLYSLYMHVLIEINHLEYKLLASFLKLVSAFRQPRLIKWRVKPRKGLSGIYLLLEPGTHECYIKLRDVMSLPILKLLFVMLQGALAQHNKRHINNDFAVCRQKIIYGMSVSKHLDVIMS